MGSRIGNYALGIAAVNDAGLWLLLGGLMTAVAGEAAGGPDMLISMGGLPIYLAVMVWLVPPQAAQSVITRRARRRSRTPPKPSRRTTGTAERYRRQQMATALRGPLIKRHPSRLQYSRRVLSARSRRRPAIPTARNSIAFMRGAKTPSPVSMVN